jgi:hypothetical protein
MSQLEGGIPRSDVMEHQIMMWPTADDDPNNWNRQRFRRRDDHDVRLAYLIVEELVADVRVNSQPIGVEVQNGVAVLTGTVDTPETRKLVGDTAQQVYGVTDVCNALEVPATVDRFASTGPFDDRDSRCSDRLFQQIVAHLADADPVPDGGVPDARRFRAFLLFLGLVLWGAVAILIIWLGWAGIVLAAAVAGVVATIVHRRAGSRGGRR